MGRRVFVNYLAQVLMSLMMLSMIILTYARASASIKRILLLDTQPSLTDTPGDAGTRQIEKEEFALKRFHGGSGGCAAGYKFPAPGRRWLVLTVLPDRKKFAQPLIPACMMSSSGEKYGLTASQPELQPARRCRIFVAEKRALGNHCGKPAVGENPMPQEELEGRTCRQAMVRSLPAPDMTRRLS